MFNLEEMASGNIVLPNSVQVGYRFHPTDEQIVSHFLKNKMFGRDDLVQPITEVEFYEFEPWELPNISWVESDDQVWFFFHAPHYGNGGRMNRSTKDGRWRVTGKNQEIKAKRTGELIGTKKILVFYKGRVRNAVKTKWVMHEYHCVDNDHHGKIYVVCRLKKKEDKKVDTLANDESENDNVDSDLQSRSIQSPMPEIQVWPEDHGALAITLPFQETSRELLDPSAHLNLENEFDYSGFVNSPLINAFGYNGEEYNDEEAVDFNDNLWVNATDST